MTDIRLTVQGLAVDYPTARVVDNVSFTLGNAAAGAGGRIRLRQIDDRPGADGPGAQARGGER